MRFVCRYCQCYWTLTALVLGDDSDAAILQEVMQIQTEQCPTMLNGIAHSLRGELE